MFLMVTMPLCNVFALKKTVVAESGIFCDVYGKGVKQGRDGARLLFTFSCDYARMNERIAASKRELRQREQDGCGF